MVGSSNCRLIKSRYMSKNCTLCVHLEDLKKSLQRYCRGLLKEEHRNGSRNWLQERDQNMKTFDRAKMCIPTTDVNINQSDKQEVKLLAQKLLNSFPKKDVSLVILENAVSKSVVTKQSLGVDHQREWIMERRKHVKKADPNKSQLTQKKRHSIMKGDLRGTKRSRSSLLLDMCENTSQATEINGGKCEASVQLSEPGNLTKQSHLYMSFSKHISKNNQDDIQLSNCGQYQQNNLDQDTETCAFPTHPNQVNDKDKVNCSVNSHMVLVPETRTVTDSSRLDTVANMGQEDTYGQQQQSILVQDTETSAFPNHVIQVNDKDEGNLSIVPHMVLVPETQAVTDSSRLDTVANIGQEDTYGQQQQSILVQDTETSAFPTHVIQVNDKDEGNLSVVPHVVLVPETQAVTDSSRLDTVANIGQEDTYGQQQQSILVQDTETSAFPTHVIQVNDKDEGNLSVVPHVVLVPETQTVNDSSRLDSVCLTNMNSIKHSGSEPFLSPSHIHFCSNFETAKNQDNSSRRIDREILNRAETQTVRESSSLAKTGIIKHNVNQNSSLSYIQATSEHVDIIDQDNTSPRADWQTLNPAEKQTMSLLSKPGDANNVTDSRHLNDQSIIDVQMIQPVKLLLKPISASNFQDGKDENNIDKSKHFNQTKCVPVSQSINSCDIINISDEDEDNSWCKQTESILQDYHFLEPSLSQDMTIKGQMLSQDCGFHTLDEISTSNLVSEFKQSLKKCLPKDNSFQNQSHQQVSLEDGGENTRNASINNLNCVPAGSSFLDVEQKATSAYTYVDSFDVVPKPAGHQYPHISITRKRNDRNKLEGVSCKLCCQYYQNCGLSKEAIKKKINDCSRHRERYHAPKTPPHFWSLDFPDTTEITDKDGECPLDNTGTRRMPRRRVPLEKKF